MGQIAIVKHEHVLGYLYVLYRMSDQASKVGFSVNPLDRAKVMAKYKSNGDVFLYFQIESGCMICHEREAHKLLAEYRLPADPEAGSTEWFGIDCFTAADAVLSAVGQIRRPQTRELGYGRAS